MQALLCDHNVKEGEEEMVTVSFNTLRRLIDARGRAEDRTAELQDMLTALQIRLARSERSAAMLQHCCNAVTRKNVHAARSMQAHAAQLHVLVDERALTHQQAMALRAQTLESIARQLAR